MNFPVVNGGKWNTASNLRVAFNRILSEAGVEQTDYVSVMLFMKFISEGMLLCAAKRGGDCNAGRNYSSEAIWLFVPKGMIVSASNLVTAADELVSMFERPWIFDNAEAFRDSLSELFLEEFPELPESGSEKIAMTGSRIGYLSFDTVEELEVILSTGYKTQYESYGLILLTDNPVPVEASLPRIYLPELMLHRQIQREKVAENVFDDSISMQENDEDTITTEESESEEALVEDIQPEENELTSKLGESEAEPVLEESAAEPELEECGLEKDLEENETPENIEGKETENTSPDVSQEDIETEDNKKSEGRSISYFFDFSQPAFYGGIFAGVLISFILFVIYIIINR